MDAINKILERKWLVAAVGLVIGIGLGLLYAWQLNPVQWVDGTPAQMRADLREDYLRMAIDSYSVNRDVDLAIQRYQALGDHAAEALAAVGANPGEVSITAIQNFRAVVEIFKNEPGTQPVPSETPAAGIAAGGPARLLLPVCLGTALLGVLLAAVLVIRSRMGGGAEGQAALEMATPGDQELETYQPETGEARPARPAVDFDFGTAPVSEREPLATFRTIYTIGEDLYDDSFSVESAAGDFLGECGVGIGDTIGVGEPKKVSAFEVWLFDKNDIQTVTKVMMSRYAFQDDETRNRLAAKGDPSQAESGGVLHLETASLEVEARVVDMSYGEGALPQESFFERMTIELRAWQRQPGTM
jgi:hypothetical protein